MLQSMIDQSENSADKAKCFVSPSSKFYNCIDTEKHNPNAPNRLFPALKLDSLPDITREENYAGKIYEGESKVPIGNVGNGIVHANSILIHPNTGFIYLLDIRCLRIQVFDSVLNYAWTIPLNLQCKGGSGISAPDAFCFFHNFICVFGPLAGHFFIYLLTHSGEHITQVKIPVAFDHWVDSIFSHEDCLYIPFYRYHLEPDVQNPAINYSFQSNFTEHTLYLQCIDSMDVGEVKLSEKFWPFCCRSYSGARFQGRNFYIATYYYDTINLSTIVYILKYNIDTLEFLECIPLESGLVSHFSTAGFILDPVTDSFWFCDIDTNRLLIFSKTGELVVGLERETIPSKNEYFLRAAPLAINHLSNKLIVSIPDGEYYFKLIDLDALRKEIFDNL